MIVAHRLGSHRLMGEGHTIEVDVFGIESKNVVDIKIKLLVLGVFGLRKLREKGHLRIGTF
jgi:hypothetical protein